MPTVFLPKPLTQDSSLAPFLFGSGDFATLDPFPGVHPAFPTCRCTVIPLPGFGPFGIITPGAVTFREAYRYLTPDLPSLPRGLYC